MLKEGGDGGGVLNIPLSRKRCSNGVTIIIQLNSELGLAKFSNKK